MRHDSNGKLNQERNNEMTQQEFTNRTGYTPTPQEFEKINEVYMIVDDDKDTFCMKWKRANRELVEWQKKAKKAADEAWKSLYAEYVKWIGIVEIRMKDPLLNFHNARHAALIEAEDRRDQLKKHIDFLNK